MTTSASVRHRLKVFLRPALAPLIRRLRLPFDVLVPRLDALEQRLAAVESPSPAQGVLENLTENVRNVRGTVENLTRTWLRMQNEIARLSTSAPEAALEAVRSGMLETEGRLRTLESSVPALQDGLSALASRLDSVDRKWRDDFEERTRAVDATIRLLLDRVEFLRRESMAEVRTGPTLKLQGDGRLRRHTNSRIVSGDRVNAALMSGSLCLNLGCGHLTRPEYINVDMRDLAGVDVVADVAMLPFETGSVDEIASTHLLEHFPQDELRHQLLPYWRTLLKPGGRLRVVVPDAQAILAGFADGSYEISELREALFGSQAYDGAFHFNLLTPESLSQLMTEAGFIDIEVPIRARRNGRMHEFELVATAPLGATASPPIALGFGRQVVA